MEEIFKGISLKNWSWIHTRASLARAVFSFKTFFDPSYRPPTPVVVDSEVRGTTLQKLIVAREDTRVDICKVNYELPPYLPTSLPTSRF